MSIKVAISGAGYIANIHARAIQSLPDAELVAVVGWRAQTRKAFAEKHMIPRQYGTVAELVADGNVDALVVCTPNFLHAPETITALRAGIHVMVEKPMAMNSDQAEDMVAASQKADSVLMVAHCWRFDEEVLWLRTQVEAEKLGSIVRTKGYGVHVNWGPEGWFTQKQSAGGGALADMGIHALDTARFLLGDPQPVSVYAQVGTYYQEFDVDDTGIVLVNWEGGTVSYIESGWWQPHSDGPEAATQLYGTRGFGEIFPTRLKLVDLPGGKQEELDPGFPHPRQEQCPQRMYDAQMAYFLDCLSSGRVPSPGGVEGLVNMRIIDALYQSSDRDEVIRLST